MLGRQWVSDVQQVRRPQGAVHRASASGDESWNRVRGNSRERPDGGGQWQGKDRHEDTVVDVPHVLKSFQRPSSRRHALGGHTKVRYLWLL
jgi:hypothetical protein